jgi:hypothetical protein
LAVSSRYGYCILLSTLSSLPKIYNLTIIVCADAFDFTDFTLCADYLAGSGSQGGVEVDFWRVLVAPFERIDVVVTKNGTNVANVLRFNRIATRESGHQAYVSTELFNFDTTPIDPKTWVLPEQCAV